MSEKREGSLEAPTRHPLGWRDPEFFDEQALERELERVYEICHGCRRCFSLCNAFPTLFDLIDATESIELEEVAKSDYWSVVDQCYLCDMCFMTKCPYVPPHPWNVDFPHLMLRAKAVKRRSGRIRWRDKLLSSTDALGTLVGRPIVAPTVNAVNRQRMARSLLQRTVGVHREAWLPGYESRAGRKRIARRAAPLPADAAQATDETRGRVVLFTTCYGNFNEPGLVEDLVAIFEHNGIPVVLGKRERCCGMPKLELGDLDAVAALARVNAPVLAELVEQGFDIVAPVPSCVLMFKQELPLLMSDDGEVAKIRSAIFDPFEYLMLRHKAGKLRTDFKEQLGKVAYHVPCHLRVQNIGLKTKEVLQLVPGTEIMPIERCSGHNGTYAVKLEFHEAAMKIGRPVVNQVKRAAADYYSSDCPMAGHHIEAGLAANTAPTHPLTLLRRAYGI
ncbi:MAG: heterodisulfide reductase-related iron-sulfur binding cluster [Gammaproteobacteria bacterium]